MPAFTAADVFPNPNDEEVENLNNFVLDFVNHTMRIYRPNKDLKVPVWPTPYLIAGNEKKTNGPWYALCAQLRYGKAWEMFEPPRDKPDKLWTFVWKTDLDDLRSLANEGQDGRLMYRIADKEHRYLVAFGIVKFENGETWDDVKGGKVKLDTLFPDDNLSTITTYETLIAQNYAGPFIGHVENKHDKDKTRLNLTVA